MQTLMFHHFHNAHHPKVLGSISEQDFRDILNHVGRDRILPAKEWMRRALADELRDEDLCLTFDDSLLCQYDVALPVLHDLGISAFWFVYSSIFEGGVELLEVYRFFGSTAFEDINHFYDSFTSQVATEIPNEYRDAKARFDPNNYLKGFPFYTDQDRLFRFLRDELLGVSRYHLIMKKLMMVVDFDISVAKENLWMKNDHLQKLHDEGHVLGLHSFSHPTRLNELTGEKQAEEYYKNSLHLESLTGEPVICMSHPCNSYNEDTLAILSKMGVKLGFRSNMEPVDQRSKLEYMRKDHVLMMKEIRQ